ncbi:MAG: arylsulfatase [Pirellulaceae bacterium]|nr:arylsulfatase [Pirellulaceae bacterium]
MTQLPWLMSIGLVAMVHASLPGLAFPQDTSKPNIVVILADDLGRHDCSFMGGQIATPRLDKLAGSGARLDAFYVQPVCSPTRAAFMTGRYPMLHCLQTGVVLPWAQYGLPLEERTIATGLRQAGYATAVVGKWHLGHFRPEYLPRQRGFDFQYGHYNGAIDYFTHDRDGGHDWHRNDKESRDEGYSTHLIAREAAQFVTEHAGKRPFFLYVPFNAVHSPHQVPPAYTQPYAQFKGDRRQYAGMLAAMDEAVGKIVDAVEQAGVANNTLFVFSSDNGGPSPGRITNNGTYRAGKGTLYEGGVRVVAFASLPGRIQAGSTIAEPMHIVDLYPTLLKLAGGSVDQPLPIDGRDVWPTITSGAPSPHESILINTTPRSGAVRAGKWKLVLKHGDEDPDGADKPITGTKSVELFDLAADPSEKVNLASQEPEQLERMKKLLSQYADQAIPPKAKPKAQGFQSPRVWGE